MVTDNPLIESCFSRTPPRPEISALAGNCFGSAWTGLGAGWKLAGADWELAESNHYDEPRLPRTILDFLEKARAGWGDTQAGLRTQWGDTRGKPEKSRESECGDTQIIVPHGSPHSYI